MGPVMGALGAAEAGGGLGAMATGALSATPLGGALSALGVPGLAAASNPLTSILNPASATPSAGASMMNPNPTPGAQPMTMGGGGNAAPTKVAPVVNATPTQAPAGAVNPKDLWEALHQQGFNDMQSAVLMGNMKQESELRPGVVNPKEGAQGLIQWRQGRLAGLQKFAAANSMSPTDYRAQAAYIRHEMQTSEAGPGQQFLSATTPEQANAALKGYIRYGDNSQGTRLANAQQFAKEFGGSAIVAGVPNGSPMAGAPGNVANTQATQPVGGTISQVADALRKLKQQGGGAAPVQAGQTPPAVDPAAIAQRKEILLSPALQLLAQLKERQQRTTLPQINTPTSPVMVGGARG